MASEFLVMAATLIHIKSRHAAAAAGDGRRRSDGRGDDPRDALVRRLLEHQRFKAAAELLHERETLRSAQWTRPDAASRRLPASDRARAGGRPVQPAGGVPARARARPRAAAGAAAARSRSRSRRASSSCSSGSRRPRPAASRSCSTTSAARGDLIVTFLALLEMIRLKLVRVFQQAPSSARSASTSGRGRRTRRTRSTIPKTSTGRIMRGPGRRPQRRRRCATTPDTAGGDDATWTTRIETTAMSDRRRDDQTANPVDPRGPRRGSRRASPGRGMDA